MNQSGTTAVEEEISKDTRLTIGDKIDYLI
eukprot:COSAG01_NODE_10116_length_2247_cov_1.790037_1_plen_30_part_10